METIRITYHPLPAPPTAPTMQARSSSGNLKNQTARTIFCSPVRWSTTCHAYLGGCETVSYLGGPEPLADVVVVVVVVDVDVVVAGGGGVVAAEGYTGHYVPFGRDYGFVASRVRCGRCCLHWGPFPSVSCCVHH